MSVVGLFEIFEIFALLTRRRVSCHSGSMPKRTRNTENLDTVQNARRVSLEASAMSETVELTVVQQVMRQMGAKGGKIGGKRRLETMTDEQRRRSARKAAKARWANTKKTA
jgi:hypothetical protein